eukprot:TRINITY_DN22413_c0_g1_i2.p1 TRINITY_DN22413_c0_g1~~TRINITY_DN22413_c0_g1_i2.p1  ORF type:complete len:432 (-),score=118.79 TRINITY_DN22413_c0_g1_i2:161-1456(-)
MADLAKDPLLQQAKHLAAAASDTRTMIQAQEGSIDALKRAMTLLNADDDPLLQPLPPMERLQCEDLLAEARSKATPRVQKPKPVRVKDRAVPIDASVRRVPRVPPGKPQADLSKNRSPDSLVKPPLPRMMGESSPPPAGGQQEHSMGGTDLARDRVRRRQKEMAEAADHKAREEERERAAKEQRSKERVDRLNQHVADRVAKQRQEARHQKQLKLQQDRQRQEQMEADEANAENKLAQERQLAARRYHAYKKASTRAETELAIKRQELSQVDKERSDEIAKRAAIEAKRRSLARRKAQKQEQLRQDESEASKQQARVRAQQDLAASVNRRREQMAAKSRTARKNAEGQQGSVASPDCSDSSEAKSSGLRREEQRSPSLGAETRGQLNPGSSSIGQHRNLGQPSTAMTNTVMTSSTACSTPRGVQELSLIHI